MPEPRKKKRVPFVGGASEWNPKDAEEEAILAKHGTGDAGLDALAAHRSKKKPKKRLK
jgi:hypothetical protein